MAKKFVPKPRGAVYAVQVHEDTNIPAGGWVAIAVGEDNVLYIYNTSAEFDAAYDPEKNATSRQVPRVEALEPRKQMPGLTVTRGPRVPGTPPKVRVLRGPTYLLKTQAGRFFYLLQSLNRPGTVHDIKALVTGLDNPTSVSPALTVLARAGLVQRLPPQTGRAALWEPTEAGRAALRELGPAAFTRLEMPVPPAIEPTVDLMLKFGAPMVQH